MLKELEIWWEVNIAKFKVLQLQLTPFSEQPRLGMVCTSQSILPPASELVLAGSTGSGHSPSPWGELTPCVKVYCGVEETAARLNETTKKEASSG